MPNSNSYPGWKATTLIVYAIIVTIYAVTRDIQRYCREMELKKREINKTRDLQMIKRVRLPFDLPGPQNDSQERRLISQSSLTDHLRHCRDELNAIQHLPELRSAIRTIASQLHDVAQTSLNALDIPTTWQAIPQNEADSLRENLQQARRQLNSESSNGNTSFNLAKALACVKITQRTAERLSTIHHQNYQRTHNSFSHIFDYFSRQFGNGFPHGAPSPRTTDFELSLKMIRGEITSDEYLRQKLGLVSPHESTSSIVARALQQSSNSPSPLNRQSQPTLLERMTPSWLSRRQTQSRQQDTNNSEAHVSSTGGTDARSISQMFLPNRTGANVTDTNARSSAGLDIVQQILRQTG